MRHPDHVEWVYPGYPANEPSLVQSLNQPGTGHMNEEASKRSYLPDIQVFFIKAPKTLWSRCKYSQFALSKFLPHGICGYNETVTVRIISIPAIPAGLQFGVCFIMCFVHINEKPQHT